MIIPIIQPHFLNLLFLKSLLNQQAKLSSLLILAVLLVAPTIYAKATTNNQAPPKFMLTDWHSINNSTSKIFVDKTVEEFPNIKQASTTQVFQLFSHGRPGELWIQDKWRNAKEIAQWLNNQQLLQDIRHLNIYGCHFAQGEKGKAAVKYLEATLGISVAASDDITGIEGDWDLEIGKAHAIIQHVDYPHNLQTCNVSDPPTNVALNQSATASSEAFGGTAAGGVDGTPSGTLYYHSASETDPWWQVDLGAVVTIGEIHYYNEPAWRGRADGIIFEILDASNTVVFTQSYPFAPEFEVISVPGIDGQYIRARLVGSNRILQFREIEVYTATLPNAYAIQASCTDGIANDDAHLFLSNITYGDAFHYSIGSTFDDNSGANTYTNAQAITGSTTQTTASLPNPSVPTDYTIRLYNGSNTCYEDIIVTLNPQDCMVGCNCEETIYLNEVTNGGAVHKFTIASNGDLTEVSGANGIPWYASSNELPDDRMGNPHGLGTDLNGNLYIGENFNGDIRRLDCLGNIAPTSDFEINDGGFHIGTNGNTLYINSFSNTGIQSYDLCSGTNTGNIGITGDEDDWGLYVDENGILYATSGFSVFSVFGDKSVTIVDLATADFSNNTFYPATWTSDSNNQDPSIGDVGVIPSGSIGGITTDPSGNIYLVLQFAASVFPTQECSRIYKYSPSGEILAISPDDCSGDGDGWNKAKDIVYSASCNCLYVSTESTMDDCVYRFNTDLTDTGISGTAVPPVPTGGQAKGMSFNKECCPANNNVIIDTVLCSANINDILYLQDIINCEGTICEGQWQEGSSNTGFTYNSCNNSITVTSLNACGTFTLKSDGDINNNRCGAFEISVNIELGFVTGATITGTQPTCANGNLSTITSSGASGSGTITYQWQMSTTSCTSGFSDIGGATSSSYDSSTLSQETYYRLITSSLGGCNTGFCRDTSACVTLTPEANCGPNCTNPDLVTTPDTICVDGTVDISILVTDNANVGGTTAYYASLAEATTQTNALGTTTVAPIVDTKYYVREDTTGCFDIDSVMVVVNNITAPVISANASYCDGDDPIALTATTAASGNGTLSYQWQSNTTGCTSTFTDIGTDGTAATYDPPVLASTTYYRVITTSTLGTEACMDTSNCITLTVNLNPTATAIAISPTCPTSGTTPNSDGTLKLMSFPTGATYQYNSGNTFMSGSAMPSTPASIPSDSLLVNNLANPSSDTDYTIRVYDSNGCFVDVGVMLTTTDCSCTTPILAALTNDTICQSTAFDTTNLATMVTNSVPVSYQWYNDNGTDNMTTTAIAGQTDSVLMVLPTTAGVYQYRVEAISTVNTVCLVSQTVTLVIHPNPTVLVADALKCTSNSETITATPSGGTIPYEYNWSGPYISDPGNVAVFNTSVPGEYMVLLTDENGCSASDKGELVFQTKVCLPVTFNIRRGSRN